MSFHAYMAQKYDHTEENQIFDTLYDSLSKIWNYKDDYLYLIGNLSIYRADIDALIIKRDAIIIIDFKNYQGKLTFENNDLTNNNWNIENERHEKCTVKGGSLKNPFKQLKQYKDTLREYITNNKLINTYKTEIKHISCMCLFQKPIVLDTQENNYDIVSKWFFISDINNYIKDISHITSNKINIQIKEIDYLIRHFNLKEYIPDSATITLEPKNYQAPLINDINLNNEEQTIANKISEWITNSDVKVQFLAGANSTGKKTILYYLYKKHNKNNNENQNNILILAPNSGIQKKYKIPQENIYSIIYNLEDSYFENNKEIFPINSSFYNYENNKFSAYELIILTDAHLLNSTTTEESEIQFGTGNTCQDFITCYNKTHQKVLEKEVPNSHKYPKLLILFDPYQLNRSTNDIPLKDILDKNNISFQIIETNSAIADKTNLDLIKFQQPLINQLKENKYLSLPYNTNNNINIIIDPLEQADYIIKSLLRWPHDIICVCATQLDVNAVNSWVHNKLQPKSKTELVIGDIIEFYSDSYFIESPNLCCNSNNPFEHSRIESRSFALVLSCSQTYKVITATLTGRNIPTKISFSTVKVLLENGNEGEILYIDNFLNNQKAELSVDEKILRNILISKEIKSITEPLRTQLNNIKNELKIEKDPNKIHEKQAIYQNLKKQIDKTFKNNKYYNAAKVKLGFAITAHRLQSSKLFNEIIVNAKKAHNTENPATRSYFTWLYTVSTGSYQKLTILNFPLLSPLSKTQWFFDNYSIEPIRIKKRIYYQLIEYTNDELNDIYLKFAFNKVDKNLFYLYKEIYFSLQKHISEFEFKILSV